MAVCQNLVPLVNIKIAGKWMFIPLKMVLIGIDPYPYVKMVLVTVSWTWDLPLCSSAIVMRSHGGLMGTKTDRGGIPSEGKQSNLRDGRHAKKHT